MKSISIYSAFLLMLLSTFSFAQTATAVKKQSIKVWGNCGMCKKTIEKAAITGGATSANWNKETKLLAVQFASVNTSSDKIQQSIATAGYDTEKFTAHQAGYDNLPECCQYERKTQAAVSEKINCCKDGVCKDGECKSCSCKDAVCKDGPCKDAVCNGKTCCKS
jgi:mercuric ion binding protein